MLPIYISVIILFRGCQLFLFHQPVQTYILILMTTLQTQELTSYQKFVKKRQ